MMNESRSNPEEQYALKELVEKALQTLDEREQKVLRLRFLEGLSLRGVAVELDYPPYPERIRQIELLALRKLRNAKDVPPEVHRYLESSTK